MLNDQEKLFVLQGLEFSNNTYSVNHIYFK